MRNFKSLILIITCLNILYCTKNPTQSDYQEKVENKNEEVEYFLEIAFGAEYGSSNARITKWTKNIKIQIFGTPTESDTLTLRTVINELNVLIQTIQLSIVKENPNVFIYFVPESKFNQYEPNYVPLNYGFFWVWWSNAKEIYKSRIMISTEDLTQKERSHIIREELTQMLGLMNDSWRYKDSIFYQGWTAVTEYAEIDKIIINWLYLEEIKPNMSKSEVLEILNSLH